MNNKCKDLKQEFNRKLKCGRTNKEVCLSECKNCKYFDRKETQANKYALKQKSVLKRTKTPLKRVSKKQAKSERERYSILIENLSVCAIDGCNNRNVKLHEVYYGKNRQNSMKYGLVIPLCVENHHTLGKEAIHNNSKLNKYWRSVARRKFEETYPNLDFTSIFKSK